MDDQSELVRHTAYSLMGADLYDTNGLNPLITWEMILIYVISTMLYGLETQINGCTQITQLEDFYRTHLR